MTPALPTMVTELLCRQALAARAVVYFDLDHQGRVRDMGGCTDRLALPLIKAGDPIASRLLFMEGLLPMDAGALNLPGVRIDDNLAVDVHLLKSDSGAMLVLLDASDHQAAWQPIQQQANERRLSGPDDTLLFEGLLTTLDVAALERTAAQRFRLIGKAPGWLRRWCPDITRQPCQLAPDRIFSFLGHFLEEAETYWCTHTDGYIKSGLWIETDADGNESLFEATAVAAGARKVLLIAQNLGIYREKQALIQKGRTIALNYKALQRLEKKLEASRRQLRQRVQERTAELKAANTRLAAELEQRKQAEKEREQILVQLQDAQKMEAIGTLAGGIAHDFNNILSAVIGFSEISLTEVAVGSTLQHNLQQVLTAGLRAKELVRQILTFSRQSETRRRPVQVRPIVVEALKLLRATLPTTIEITQNLTSDAAVVADPTQLHQVVMNLCTNAGHAMEQDGGRLTVVLEDHAIGTKTKHLHPNLKPGAYIRLTVSDTGHGMTEEVLRRIYDPFFTTKGPGRGTGMGLSVVHGIVKTCRGHIDVTSQPGRGSTLCILLPCAAASAGPATDTGTALTGGHEHILFVDDEPMQTTMASQMLEKIGYRVTACTDALRALEIFTGQPDHFDLVITDMTMPHMTGKTLAQKMLQQRPDLPVILCSGYSENVSREQVQALGIRDYLLKPLTMAAMAGAIRRVLDDD